MTSKTCANQPSMFPKGSLWAHHNAPCVTVPWFLCCPNTAQTLSQVHHSSAKNSSNASGPMASNVATSTGCKPLTFLLQPAASAKHHEGLPTGAGHTTNTDSRPFQVKAVPLGLVVLSVLSGRGEGCLARVAHEFGALTTDCTGRRHDRPMDRLRRWHENRTGWATRPCSNRRREHRPRIRIIIVVLAPGRHAQHLQTAAW